MLRLVTVTVSHRLSVEVVVGAVVEVMGEAVVKVEGLQYQRKIIQA
jgi:hypothetical protein